MRRINWSEKISIYMIVISFSLFSSFSSLINAEEGKEKNGNIHEVIVLKNKFLFSPQELTIKVGDTVKWINNDVRRHHFATIPGSGPTDELEIFHLFEPSDSWSHTFNTPGEYPYFCFIHNQMRGKIIVVNEKTE
ncbi:MAG: plastocyanin/azurin family copper-binding protein [Nitrospirota bacterium]